MKLQNKVAVVTGAGSGMGKSIVERFAAEGASVVAADIVKESLDRVISGIQGSGGRIVGVQANVAVEEDVTKMIDTAVKEFGRLDILVNNAGIMDDFIPAADLTDEQWERVIAVNLSGPFRACRKAIPIMIKQGGGVIVNTASIGGLYGARAGAAYTASKHGLVGLTKNIGYFYTKQGIRCNAICPGGVETNIVNMQNAHEEGMKVAMSGAGTAVRQGDPAEIANLALFLASDESSLINGTTVVADAGWTAY